MIKKICLVLISFGVTLGVMFVNSKTKTLNEKDIMANNKMALYIEKDGTYEKTNAIPKGDYVLNSSKSKCSNGAIPKWNSNTNSLKLSNLTKDNTSCYLYFDLTESGKVLNQLGLTSNGEVDSFTGPSCNNSNCGGSGSTAGTNMQQNGVYETEDDYGTSYYYRGTVDNNWVIFGQDNDDQYIWWRIIRINGNGTIRLIYAGTSTSTTEAPNAQGANTMITPRTPANNSYPKSVKFNTNYNDNKYVGYMYNGDPTVSTSHDQAHKVTNDSTKSTVLDEIENWYTNNTNLGDLLGHIDVDTGFCSDTTISTTNHGSGYPGTGQGFGTQQTAYAGTDRVWQASISDWNSTEQTPTLKCGKDAAAQKRDLYTGPGANANGTKGSNGTTITGNNTLPVPVGLITMDEVIYAGGFAGQTNNGYWLYTNQYYWTMSPYNFNGSHAVVFNVNNDGRLYNTTVDNTIFGIRPVINLKANTTFTFDKNGTEGTPENPYVVE